MKSKLSIQNKFVQYPLWLVGFRPLFLLALISGIIFPLVWISIFSGLADFSSHFGWSKIAFSSITPTQWHAHEMLFGFGWAVLSGFLLTASKNWVKVRGIHGWTLVLATLLWLLERCGMAFYENLTPTFRLIVMNAFSIYVVGYILWTLIYYRKQDSFRDNFIFMLVLPLFIFAKNLSLDSTFYTHGWSLGIGLYRIAIAVMLERTMTQFMKNSMQVNLVRHFFLDFPIKILIVLCAFESWFSPTIASLILGLTTLFLGVRFFLWKPLVGFKTFGTGISYAAYLGLLFHLLFATLNYQGLLNMIGALTVHIFSFLCFGLIVPAMIIRIAQGHTGRTIAFPLSDRIAFGFMFIAAFFRLIATQLWPQNYSLWIIFAGSGWALCFSILAWRLMPFLLSPRIDGK